VAVALLGYRSFVANLSNFLDVLLVVFIPWSAVNLADYFVVRRARYDVGSFFVPDGEYGRFAWPGLVAYAVGLAAEWPFVSQPDYTGPFVKHLGGADISWLVGWVTAAAVYLLAMRLVTATGRRGLAAATRTESR
jgi:NCS1 family nucleobase:cation symporter-1